MVAKSKEAMEVKYIGSSKILYCFSKVPCSITFFYTATKIDVFFASQARCGLAVGGFLYIYRLDSK